MDLARFAGAAGGDSGDRGSDDSQPDPESEAELGTFLAEAIDAHAETSGISRPQIKSFVEAGVLTASHGLVVSIGTTEFQVTVVRTR